jgi:hypothetical protein
MLDPNIDATECCVPSRRRLPTVRHYCNSFMQSKQHVHVYTIVTQPQRRHQQKQKQAEQVGIAVTLLDPYSVGILFESRPRHWLSILWFFMVVPVTPGEWWGCTRITLRPLPFKSLYHSSHHSAQYSLLDAAVVKRPHRITKITEEMFCCLSYVTE